MNTNLQLMDTLRHSVGMVIPVWFPPSLSADHRRDTLLSTLHDCDHYLPWEQVVLVVDGDERSYVLVQELQESCKSRDGMPFDVVYNPENRGKGYAVLLGARWLLQKPHLAYLTTRDVDGDHTLNDLLNLLRQALVLREAEGTDRLIVIGRRSHPHRALGFVRGEFEALMNRVILDAVKFALAQRQEVLKTQYFALSGEYPDLHSGYKLYSRQICALMIRESWERPPWVGDEIYRYGVEAVPFVEGVMAGASVGEITRLTQEPDFSGHGAFARPQSNGSVILWTFLWLGIKPQQAAAILDNHLSRLTLWTNPEGRAALLELRRYVLETMRQSTPQPEHVPEARAGLYF
jgi:hypothetical protein